jgi:hypothetical protein
MTHAELIAAMLQTARPVIQQYWTDLTHDARTIAAAQEGDVFFWAPYSHGTRLVCAWRGDRPNTHARELMDAMQACDPPPQWFRIVIGFDDTFGLDAVPSSAAAEECAAASRTARDPSRETVSQMHL